MDLKVILPKISLKPKKFEDDIKKRYKRLQQQVRRDLQKTISTWDEKPDVSVKRIQTPDGFIFRTFVDSEIWHYIDKGTDPYEIRPKPDNPTGKLWFKVPSSPKSQPGLLKSGRGGLLSDSKLVAVDKVDHPGIRPRNWTKIIKERYREKSIDEGNEALRQWMQQSTRPARKTR